MLKNFSEQLKQASGEQNSTHIVILLPRERRICKLVLQELSDLGISLDQYTFANMAGLSRFINELSVIKNNAKHRQSIEAMEDRLKALDTKK